MAGNTPPLPRLRRLTVYEGCGYLDISALIQCAKARKQRSRLLEEVTLVFETEPEADVLKEVKSLRGFVGVLSCRVGEAPELR